MGLYESSKCHAASYGFRVGFSTRAFFEHRPHASRKLGRVVATFVDAVVVGCLVFLIFRGHSANVRNGAQQVMCCRFLMGNMEKSCKKYQLGTTDAGAATAVAGI